MLLTFPLLLSLMIEISYLFQIVMTSNVSFSMVLFYFSVLDFSEITKNWVQRSANLHSTQVRGIFEECAT